MLNLISLGIVMGFAFAAPPGIVAAETFRRGIARGFPAALSVQLGSLIGDATYCLLALAGAAMLAQNPLTQHALGVFSVFLLLYLAITGIRAELAPARLSTRSNIQPTNARGAFATGMFLSLTNPWAIGYWLSLGGALAASGAMESGAAMALFFVSFFGVCAAYAVGIALLIGVARRALPVPAARWISIASSAAIGILGIGLAWQVMQTMFV
ncbi:MAG: LysE family transporter [Chloroflexi bacterium]|nr:LysE family transporter [Chloroflexota bacterium]